MKNKNFVLCGMGFGDEGKGSFVDYLAKVHSIPRFVRYNGGSHSDHKVITPENIMHTFAQIGSGALANGFSTTYLTKNMVVNLGSITRELEALRRESIACLNVYNSIYIDMDCLIITSYHILINRMQELVLDKNSCDTVDSGVNTVKQLEDMGIKVRDVYNAALVRLRYKDELEYDLESKDDASTIWLDLALSNLRKYAYEFFLNNKDKIFENVKEASEFGIYEANRYIQSIKEWFYRPIEKIRKELIYDLLSVPNASYTEFLEDCIPSIAIYEGSQGLLIDKKFGTRPNATYLDTTVNYATQMLDKRYLDYKKIGIIKAFYTRHGKGVFPTESHKLTAVLRDESNSYSLWNGSTRYGWFDAILFNYANQINKVDEIYISAMDRLFGCPYIKICYQYIYTGEIDEEFKEIFEYTLELDNIIITKIKADGVGETCKDISEYLKMCKPRYLEIKGWVDFTEREISEIKTASELPQEMLNYINLIEKFTGVPVTVISLGPTRYNKVVLKNEQT